jgi:cell division inhibitor SulA
MPFEHCQGCEMRASCARDRRCWRPRTVTHWLKELEEADHAVRAALKRMGNAAEGLLSAWKREKGIE